MRITIVALALVMSGCAPTLTGVNQAGGMISNVRTYGFMSNADQAFASANGACRNYGKVARIGNNVGDPSNPTTTVTFECVAP